jgi:hypothetical protein
MKCSVCGKEFGEGTNCQYCGVDRVTGLANFGSYGTSNYQGTNTPHYNSSYNYSPKTMACYSCGEIIPINSEYCPYCSKELYVTCPKCGHKYSSQFPACNKCGTNRSQYYRKLEAEKEEARRLEEERRQEQERNERQHRQLNNQSYLFKIFGFLALIIGGVILVVIITEHGSLSINELMLVIALLIMGILFLCPKIME